MLRHFLTRGLPPMVLTLLLPLTGFATVIEHEYDAMNRRVLTRYEDGTAVEQAYDAAGNRVRLEKRAGSPPVVLTAVEVSGPSQVDESAAADFGAVAHFSNGSQATVTAAAQWGENSPHAAMDPSIPGRLATGSVSADSPCAVTAGYTHGAVTLTGVRNVTIRDIHRPGASVSPAGWDFGALAVGQASGAQAFTLWSTGGEALTPAALKLAGNDPGHFKLTGGDCVGAVLPPGGHCTLAQVRFQPLSTGSKSAHLSLAHNAPASPLLIALSGTGQPAPQPPAKATAPVPADGASGLPANTDLAWSDGGGASSFDVYLGTAASPGSGQYRGRQAATSFDPGILAPATTYYWRIDAVNAAGATTGTVWSFATAVAPPAAGYGEDFEDSLGAEWSTYRGNTTYGRNEVSSYSAMEGSRSWRMDVTANNNYSLNELVLHVQVTGATWLKLAFATREYADETHSLPSAFSGHANGDGIAVSTDGVNWKRLWQYPAAVSAWTAFGPMDIAPLVPPAGDLYIKFQQYDNYTFTTDGILWDDIRLTSDGVIGML